MKNRLTIAIQKKGRLFDQSTDLIKKSGINFSTKGDNLYQFWGDKINRSLQHDLKDKSHLINLSSNEYYKSVMCKKIKKKIISPIFLDKKKGKYKVVSFFAKRARGAMTNYIIKNQVEDIDVLKKFNGLGYKFNFNKSTDTDMVFCR